MTIKTILSCVILSAFITPQISCKYNHLFSTESTPGKPPYPVPGKLVKNMNEEELEKVLVYAKIVKDVELAYKVFFYLISQSKSQDIIKTYKLDYGDYAFEQEDYEKALAAYEDFAQHYPGSTQAEYARYKIIVCTFFLSLSFDRDQTQTHRTISLCLLFAQKAKNEKFLAEVQKTYNTCRKRLFDHEVYVLETYLKQVKISSAQHRLEYIQKEFTDIAHLQEYVEYLSKFIETVKEPKTRPFFIQVNLKNALSKTDKQVDASSVQKTTSFFLA